MIHYVYIGHFVHEGSFIKFHKQPDGLLRPAVATPLTTEEVEKALKKTGSTSKSIPEGWGVWLVDGYVICDRFSRSKSAIEFARRLAVANECDLADYSSQSLMTPNQLFSNWRPQRHPDDQSDEQAYRLLA